MRRFRQIAAVTGIVMAIQPFPAFAADPPAEAALAEALEAGLPAWWSVQAVEIVGSDNEGDDVTPRFRQRFVADALPREDLFLPVPGDGRIGPFAVLVATAPASGVRKLYGTAVSVVELGELSTRIELENTVLGVGLPLSRYADPAVIAGTEGIGEAAGRLLDLHALSRTLAEGIAGSAVDAEELDRLASERRAELERLNRERIDALRARHEQEALAARAAAGRQLEEETAAGRARIAALRAEVQAEIEATARRKDSLERQRQALVEESGRMMEELEADLAAERERLIAESKAAIEELRAGHERRREDATAAQETLDAVANAEAERQAQARLGEALTALSEERKRVAGIVATIDAEDVARRKARRETVAAALSADDPAERKAAMESILAGHDDGVKRIAIETALASDDLELVRAAFGEALRSGVVELREKAMSRKVMDGTRIVLSILDESGGVRSTHFLDPSSFDPERLTFAGDYNPHLAFDTTERSSANAIRDGAFQIHGTWKDNYDRNQACSTTARPDEDGAITGTIRCDGHQNKYAAKVRIDM